MPTPQQIAEAVVERIDGLEILADGVEWYIEDVSTDSKPDLLLENDSGEQITARVSVEVLP